MSGLRDKFPFVRVSWRQLVEWVHLVYLVIPALQPIFDPEATLAEWLLVAGVLAVFIPMYVAAMRRPDHARWWCTVPATVIAAATTPFNAGMAVLFVYAAATAGISESRRVALRWFIGLTMLVGLLGLVSSVPMPWRLWGVIPPLLFIWVIGLIMLEEVERERAATELRQRNARIEHLATLTERERIARDLHDLLGHTLTSIVLRAQLARELVEADPDRARKEADDIERTARNALGEVRTTVQGWRQASLDAELESARTTLAGVGVDLGVHRDGKLAIVDSTEHELALILREAVTNVARHARARTCHVGIDSDDGQLRMVIADDGVGGNAADGNGLAGMRERVAALGGTVRRNGSTGTTVTVAVPLEVAI